MAAQAAGAKKKAAGLLQDIEVQALDLSPFHELQVEISGIFDDVLGVQLRFEVHLLGLTASDFVVPLLVLFFALAPFVVRFKVQDDFAIEAVVEADALLRSRGRFFINNLTIGLLLFLLLYLLPSDSVFDKYHLQNMLLGTILRKAVSVLHKLRQIPVDVVVQQYRRQFWSVVQEAEVAVFAFKSVLCFLGVGWVSRDQESLVEVLAVTFAQLQVDLLLEELQRLLVNLFGQLLSFQGLELLSSLHQTNPVMIIVILQITEASHYEVIIMDMLLQVRQSILFLQLFALRNGLEVERIVLLDGIEVYELAWDLEVDDAACGCLLRLGAILVIEEAVTIDDQAGCH